MNGPHERSEFWSIRFVSWCTRFSCNPWLEITHSVYLLLLTVGWAIRHLKVCEPGWYFWAIEVACRKIATDWRQRGWICCDHTTGISCHACLNSVVILLAEKRRISMCVGCGSQIHDQYILRVAPDLEWHASCLKCADCHTYLDETCTCFVRDGKTYCKRDYVRWVVGSCAQRRELLQVWFPICPQH